MTKELTPLEAFDIATMDPTYYYVSEEERSECKDIVETALNNYEELEEQNKQLTHVVLQRDKTLLHLNHELAELRNKFEIIREKRVDVSWLMKCFGFIENSTNEEECEYYNSNYEAYRNSKSLTQEEFNLLKAELTDDII